MFHDSLVITRLDFRANSDERIVGGCFAAHNFRLKSQGVLVRVTEMLVSLELQLHGRRNVITAIVTTVGRDCLVLLRDVREIE